MPIPRQGQLEVFATGNSQAAPDALDPLREHSPVKGYKVWFHLQLPVRRGKGQARAEPEGTQHCLGRLHTTAPAANALPSFRLSTKNGLKFTNCH